MRGGKMESSEVTRDMKRGMQQAARRRASRTR